MIFFAPTFGGLFLEAPNFEPANPLQTPPHIAPVWYFTPFYAMLRAVPSFAGTQVWGVLVMGASILVCSSCPGSTARRSTRSATADRSTRSCWRFSWCRSSRLGLCGLKPPAGIYPLLAKICTRLVFRVLFADALVHAIRQREAGAGEGHRVMIRRWLLAIALLCAAGLPARLRRWHEEGEIALLHAGTDIRDIEVLAARCAQFHELLLRLPFVEVPALQPHGGRICRFPRPELAANLMFTSDNPSTASTAPCRPRCRGLVRQAAAGSVADRARAGRRLHLFVPEGLLRRRRPACGA